MANGFSLTRRDGLPPVAEAFAAAGADVLLFDHRYFGESGGEPRQRFRTRHQLADWRGAVATARSWDGIDPDRIVPWGFSMSGAHAIRTAGADPRIAATIVFCPYVDGLHRVLSTPPRLGLWITPRALLDAAGRHTTVPVTAPPGGHAAMTLPGEFEGFELVRGEDSLWQNRISPALFLTAGFHRPSAKRIRGPVWIGLGEQDITAPAPGIHRIVREAPRAELHRYDLDHFNGFVPGTIERIAADQVDFLRRNQLLG